ncbi:MAG: class I SAM-dependent methyltransferase [Leptospira sp.]|nr:class I SAM-dependent methyltransferase [Leptospira sp.]NCS95550.1 class I SAM-dependent methyltransferase [Leptospira sp.]
MYPKANNGFVMDEKYWDALYGETYDIDGVFNAKQHASYVKALFALMETKVQSLGDFGFGKAALLREFVKAFKPARVLAVEPSPERVEELRSKAWIEKVHIQIHNSNLQDFNPPYLKYAPMDLIICNSVFQYMEDKDVKKVAEKLSKSTRFLYFTVPTKKDYLRMKKQIAFSDPYAYARSTQFYRKILSKHFNFVSFNLLESKYQLPSVFEEELFRF